MLNTLSLRTVSAAFASVALALTVAVGAHAGAGHSVLNDGATSKTPTTMKDGGAWCC